MRPCLTSIVFGLVLVSAASAQAQSPAPPPGRPPKRRWPSCGPSAAARVFTLAPYNVNVEQRQPRPQGASLHDAQAEFFYVIDGAATLLTGGTLTAPTRTGANVAGTGIEGGVRQAFRKGDFLLVPAGVPHQFVDIQAPVRLLQLYLPEPGK